jgi:tetratricopeptide (TPR) repeat protein
MVENPGRILTREELFKAVWPDAVVEEGSLSQNIFLLRKALAGGGDDRRYIQTIAGRGYQFVAKVTTAATPEPRRVEPFPESRETPHSPRPSDTPVGRPRLVSAAVPAVSPAESRGPAALHQFTSASHRWRLWLAAAVVILIAAAAAYFFWHRTHPSAVGHIDVVLADFENNTGDPDFDHALQQALQIDLEQSPFINLLPASRVRGTLTQMEQPPTAALTPLLAREVCERNNAQVMLHGSIAKLGNQYLLLLGAESCVTGREVAGARAEAASKEQVLASLDTAAGRLRKQLGEAPASIERFQMPVEQATTPSLEALRAYSEALLPFARGDEKTAQTLLEHAISLDPNFAAAYNALSTTYYNRGDFVKAAELSKKAFDLRGRATERERLSLEISYYAYSLNDYEQAIRSLRTFLSIYPQSGAGWTNLCNLYTQLGEYPQAIEAGRSAVRVDPKSGIAATVLARAYKRANRFAEAKQTARDAIAVAGESWGVHSILFQIAFAEGDAAAIKSEGDWGLTHAHLNQSYDDLANAAATEGRLHQALDYFSRSHLESIRGGDNDYANAVLIDAAQSLIAFGQPEQAAIWLKQLQGDNSDPADTAFTWAGAGDISLAQKFIATSDPNSQQNTIRVFVDLPRLRAIVALDAHKPQDAVTALEPARPYQLRDFAVPWLRARAEFEAGQLDAAADDYRLILNNQGVDPIAPVYSLSHLELARVLAQQQKVDAARAEYKAFLNSWKNADANLATLAAAKKELASLPAASPQP